MKFYCVNSIVTDLLKVPDDTHSDESLRESQLLYNEEVRVLNESSDFYYVEAVEQLSFRQSMKWAPYRGWVKKKDLVKLRNPIEFNAVVVVPFLKVQTKKEAEERIIPFGSKIHVEPFSQELYRYYDGRIEGYVSKDSVRVVFEDEEWNILEDCRVFLNLPYLWGGRSVYLSESVTGGVKTGVDCSGLVNLVFRVRFKDIPRDAHEQSLFCKRIKKEDLTLGDLIFFSRKEEPEIVTHVALYLGFGTYIEASSKEGKVVKRFDRTLIDSSLGGLHIEREGLVISFGRVN